jgi:hypothetical protein
MTPSLRPVASSSIAAVGFDAEVSTLFVRFHSGGTYRYFGVPASVHAAFVEAESMGAFLQTEIRPRYPAERVA